MHAVVGDEQSGTASSSLCIRSIFMSFKITPLKHNPTTSFALQLDMHNVDHWSFQRPSSRIPQPGRDVPLLHFAHRIGLGRDEPVVRFGLEFLFDDAAQVDELGRRLDCLAEPSVARRGASFGAEQGELLDHHLLFVLVRIQFLAGSQYPRKNRF
jgi:hypothetical protein